MRRSIEMNQINHFPSCLIHIFADDPRTATPQRPPTRLSGDAREFPIGHRRRGRHLRRISNPRCDAKPTPILVIGIQAKYFFFLNFPSVGSLFQFLLYRCRIVQRKSQLTANSSIYFRFFASYKSFPSPRLKWQLHHCPPHKWLL